MIRDVIFFIILFIGFAASQFFNTLQHEGAHEAFEKSYGCDQIVKTYDWQLGGTTTCEHRKYNLTREEQFQLKQLNSLNEIIGYNMTSMTYSLYVLAIVILCYINTFRREK